MPIRLEGSRIERKLVESEVNEGGWGVKLDGCE